MRKGEGGCLRSFGRRRAEGSADGGDDEEGSGEGVDNESGREGWSRPLLRALLRMASLERIDEICKLAL